MLIKFFKLEISKKKENYKSNLMQLARVQWKGMFRALKMSIFKVKMSLINDKLVLVKKLKRTDTHIHTPLPTSKQKEYGDQAHHFAWNTQIITEKIHQKMVLGKWTSSTEGQGSLRVGKQASWALLLPHHSVISFHTWIERERRPSRGW